MLEWTAYLLVVSGTLSLAGLSLERALRPYGASTRWIWICALLGSLVMPVALSSTAGRAVGAVALHVPEIRQVTGCLYLVYCLPHVVQQDQEENFV